jgi:hypothetical protein
VTVAANPARNGYSGTPVCVALPREPWQPGPSQDAIFRRGTTHCGGAAEVAGTDKSAAFSGARGCVTYNGGDETATGSRLPGKAWPRRWRPHCGRRRGDPAAINLYRN